MLHGYMGTPPPKFAHQHSQIPTTFLLMYKSLCKMNSRSELSAWRQWGCGLQLSTFILVASYNVWGENFVGRLWIRGENSQLWPQNFFVQGQLQTKQNKKLVRVNLSIQWCRLAIIELVKGSSHCYNKMVAQKLNTCIFLSNGCEFQEIFLSIFMIKFKHPEDASQSSGNNYLLHTLIFLLGFVIKSDCTGQCIMWVDED